MDVKPATITNWKKGNRFPKYDVLIKIADYFDCSLDYLLDRTDDCLEKIYSKKIYPQTIKIQVNNGLVYDLTAEEIQNIIRQLDFAGFNVKKLIESAKNISL